MGLSKLWGKDSSGARGFVFSHVKSIYYNWSQKKLLSTKLDEIDKSISSLNSSMDLHNRYGYATYPDTVSQNAVWATNLGQSTSQWDVGEENVAPASYNLHLDVPGTYIVICRVSPSIASSTGIRGIRLYINENTNQPEEFFPPVEHANGMIYLIRCITVETSAMVRMGVYQTSGQSVTWTGGRIDAIRIG